MSKFDDIKKLYEAHADPESAVGMKKYMREQFEYYGVSSSNRCGLRMRVLSDAG